MKRDTAVEYELAGFIDTPESRPASDDVARHCMGTLDQLETILMQHAIDEVCIALPIKSQYPAIQETLLVCERVGVRTKYQADLFTSEVAWPRYDNPGSPMVTMHVVPDDHRLAVKRLFDVLAAAAGIVLLSPVMLLAAIAIKLTSPGPVFFAQERYGLNRRRFMMLKFRTMVADAEQLQEGLEAHNEAIGPVFKIALDPRVTQVGRFLRRTSIDELPQLFNILRGDMTVVGPRPLPLRDVTRITRAADMRRFSVRPGLTGLWQISGRSTLSFSDWITLDLTYIDRWSLALDWLILLRTIPAVVRGTGAH
jgi:exopolysaccharide biosynthesis polyprenyl glycosylphosphotransferase